MKPESVSKSLRIGFGPYTDASSGWSKLASVDATAVSKTSEYRTDLGRSVDHSQPAIAIAICLGYAAFNGQYEHWICPSSFRRTGSASSSL